MGYRISLLKNLPTHHDFYFVLLGDYEINGRINNLFRDDFNYIADNIANSAIVQSTNINTLEHEIRDSLRRVILKNYDLGKLFRSIESRMPGLLIIDRHPSEIDEESLIIFIAFSELAEMYSDNNNLVQDLIALAERKNMDIVEKVKNKERFLTRLKDALLLQPNICGFGINLHKLL